MKTKMDAEFCIKQNAVDIWYIQLLYVCMTCLTRFTQGGIHTATVPSFISSYMCCERVNSS
jgi:hypothetical protein